MERKFVTFGMESTVTELIDRSLERDTEFIGISLNRFLKTDPELHWNGPIGFFVDHDSPPREKVVYFIGLWYKNKGGNPERVSPARLKPVLEPPPFVWILAH
jgi:hypothetical protein